MEDDKIMRQKKQQKAKRPSAQAYLPIAEIKDGVVVLKNGSMRKILLTSSINFALKSEDEQNALISSYVGFLNSLDFPLQILVQSRKLHIQPYIDKLITLEREHTNELLREQIADYRSFVRQLVDIGQIMTKRFYVVVPFDPMSNKKKGFFSRAKEILTPAVTIRLKEDRFRKRKEDLDMRVRSVVSGLEGMGLSVAELDTQTVIELFYSTYNPETAFTEPLVKIDDLQIEHI